MEKIYQVFNACPTEESVLSLICGKDGFKRIGPMVGYMACIMASRRHWFSKKTYLVEVIRFDSQDEMYFRNGLEIATHAIKNGDECHVFENGNNEPRYQGLFLERFHVKAIEKTTDNPSISLKALFRLSHQLTLPMMATKFNQVQSLTSSY